MASANTFNNTAFPSSGLADQSQDKASDADRMPSAAQYGMAVLYVAVAGVLAFVVQHLIAAPNLSLIFVLPVVIAATAFGWGPAFAAVVTGVLAFDFFFLEPRFTLRVASPTDLWAMGLLLVIAAIVSTVAGHARQRAMEARAAAKQAEALQGLAHIVIEGRPKEAVVRGGAAALNRVFRAPAVVLMHQGGRLIVGGEAGGAGPLGSAEFEAARSACETGVPARAGVYPNDASTFDFWPISTPVGCECVLGVDFNRAEDGRPVAPERLVEAIGAYVAVALKGSPRRF